MAKLTQRAGYLEYDEGFDWSTVLNSIFAATNNIIEVAGKKRAENIKLQDARLDLQTKLGQLDPDIQKSILQSSPEMRRFLIDPKAIPKDQQKALERGEITPLMPKIRPRTPLEAATLSERTESARKEAALASEAESKAALQGDVTTRRRSMMGSENVYEQIVGLTGEALTEDKLSAALMGLDNPKGVVTKYRAGIPGTIEFKTEVQQKALAEILSKVNPQTPQDMLAAQETASYIAGMGPMPKKMPKSLERIKTDIDAMQARVASQNAALSKQRFEMETNAKIHALGDTLSVRLPKERRGEAFAIAEGMIKKGKFPADLPPDMAAIVAQEAAQTDLLMKKLDYEHTLQKSPKLSQLLEFAQRSASAGDDKGAQQYIRMAEVERKKIYGEDKVQQNNFWEAAVSGAIASAASGGTMAGPAIGFANLAPEKKATIMKWAGATTGEVYKTLTETVPSAIKSAAEHGVVTSPGQAADGYRPALPGLPVTQPQPSAQDTKTPALQPATLQAVAPSKLQPDQLKKIEDLVRDIEKLGALSPQDREMAIQVLDIIQEVKDGKRPFADIIGIPTSR